MGQAGNELLLGEHRELIIDTLDLLYCRHPMAVHYALAIGNRLAGQALFLRKDEIEEVLAQNLDSARKLAERIAELDGAVTGDSATLAERGGVGPFELPNCSDLSAILAVRLDAVRATIRAYRDALATTQGDELSSQLLLKLVRLEIARESELESVVPS